MKRGVPRDTFRCMPKTSVCHVNDQATFTFTLSSDFATVVLLVKRSASINGPHSDFSKQS